MEMRMPKNKVVTFRVDARVYAKLIALAKKVKRFKGDVVRLALEDYLRER
jgi:predicted transcriptional regulator